MSNFISPIHYKLFRQAWARAVNSPNAKKCVAYKSLNGYYVSLQKHEEVIKYTHQEGGWVTGAHHIIFNLLIGKPWDHGFSKTRGTAFKKAVSTARYYIWEANRYLDPSRKRPQSPSHILEFLKPFDEFVNILMLSNLEVSE